MRLYGATTVGTGDAFRQFLERLTEATLSEEELAQRKEVRDASANFVTPTVGDGRVDYDDRLDAELAALDD